MAVWRYGSSLVRQALAVPSFAAEGPQGERRPDRMRALQSGEPMHNRCTIDAPATGTARAALPDDRSDRPSSIAHRQRMALDSLQRLEDGSSRRNPPSSLLPPPSSPRHTQGVEVLRKWRDRALRETRPSHAGAPKQCRVLTFCGCDCTMADNASSNAIAHTAEDSCPALSLSCGRLVLEGRPTLPDPCGARSSPVRRAVGLH
jgi:hypothetical protein